MAVRSTRRGLAPCPYFGNQYAFLRLAHKLIIARHSRFIGIVIWIGRETQAGSKQGLWNLRLGHLQVITVLLVLQSPAESEYSRKQYNGAKSDESSV
jgi:hypothetical protein